MSDRDRATMALEADAWHQDDEGLHYIDCPECGSPATIPNVVAHGRCNAFLEAREAGVESPCAASLSLDLRYDSAPPEDD